MSASGYREGFAPLLPGTQLGLNPSTKAGCMSTNVIPTPSTPNCETPAPSRPTWHVIVLTLMMFTGAFSLVGLAPPATAGAATLAVDQCNGHGPAAQGATTAMRCTVAVVNTISGISTRSSTTVTRLCTLGPCSTPNGTFTTTSASLVTVIRQCNSSDNDASHAISCSVTVTNLIGRSTPGAQPIGAPRVTQCVGSAKGGGGSVDCNPGRATGTMVTQCNGSGNGGGGAVHCSVDPRSRVSRAIPVKITQCNGTGNVGGSTVSCTASVITSPTTADPVPAVTTGATPSPTTATAATSTPATPGTSPSPTPLAASAAGSEAAPATGIHPETVLMIGAGLVLAAAIGTLLFRRFGGLDLVRRLTPKD